MKKAFSILFLMTILSSCGGNEQNKAEEQAEQIQKAVKENRPGTVPTSEDGWTMKAKVDGKDWVAAYMMMPPDDVTRIIGYKDEQEYIGFSIDKRSLSVGRKITFSESNVVDLATDDDIGMWGGRKGEIEITKVDDKWAEGKFFFTASTSRSNKTVEVTDGFFRVSLAKNQ